MKIDTKIFPLFQVQSMFGKHIDRGVLEVISPPADFYPNLTNLRPTLGDEPERVQWRSKQVDLNITISGLLFYGHFNTRFVQNIR